MALGDAEKRFVEGGDTERTGKGQNSTGTGQGLATRFVSSRSGIISLGEGRAAKSPLLPVNYVTGGARECLLGVCLNAVADADGSRRFAKTGSGHERHADRLSR